MYNTLYYTNVLFDIGWTNDIEHTGVQKYTPAGAGPSHLLPRLMTPVQVPMGPAHPLLYVAPQVLYTCVKLHTCTRMYCIIRFTYALTVQYCIHIIPAI